MVVLDSRLEAVAKLVRPQTVLADIGTDHGYLVCNLLESGHCRKGYACDINPKPLEKARRLIGEKQLEGRIYTVLTNGLNGLPWEEIDDFVMAGIGGDLICDILSEALWTRTPRLDKHFILQPMSKSEHLRRWLWNNGFQILREVAVESGKFVYTVLSVEYRCLPTNPAPDFFAWTGTLPKNTDSASIAYLQHVQEQLQRKVKGMSCARQQKSTREILLYKNLVNEVGQALERMRGEVEC